MDGNNEHQISISDERSVRSPRFMEGETYTLYGTADGLSKLKKAGVGGTLSSLWKGDKGTEVPDIDVYYTNKDDYEEWSDAIINDNTDYHIAR